jgi:hypothetical protein
MKIVINKCFGGFHPSKKAILEMMRLGCPHMRKSSLEKWMLTGRESEQELREQIEGWYGFPIIKNEVITDEHRYSDRTCPVLVKVVESLGREANGSCSDLKVVEIPDGIEWGIEEYDGMETIHEKHRSWG